MHARMIRRSRAETMWTFVLFVLLGFMPAPAETDPGAALIWATSPSLSDSGTNPTDPPPIPKPNLEQAIACPVIRVVTGDTLIVRIDGKSQRVSLFGVEAPPLSVAFGKQARDYLDNLLRGESIYVEHFEEAGAVDAFGRAAIRAFRVPDGLYVNVEVVRQGHGAAANDLDTEQSTLFGYYANRAKTLKKGQWAAPPVEAQDTTRPRAEKNAESASRTERANPAPQPAADDEVIVYRTDNGKKYHRKDCYHARKSGKPITLKEAKAQGLEPCSHCDPPK